MIIKNDNKIEGAIHTPTMGVWDSLDEQEQDFIKSLTHQVVSFLKDDPNKAVTFVNSQMLDVDETIALWTRLDSSWRSLYKKAQRGEL